LLQALAEIVAEQQDTIAAAWKARRLRPKFSVAQHTRLASSAPGRG
jgi:hypothetical protein